MMKVMLQYFSLKGLGEAPRMLLVYGGQEFHDLRVPLKKWPEYKADTPFGQMPVMCIDGKKYSQSVAISRYLGRKYGLGGDNLEEDLVIDQNVDFLYDIRNKAAAVLNEEDKETKTRKHRNNITNVYPDLLLRLDGLIQENNDHIAAGKLTWADFVFAGMYDYLKFMMKMPDIDEKHPCFSNLQHKVLSLPQLRDYLASAPKCERNM